jgi:hypothetical protein
MELTLNQVGEVVAVELPVVVAVSQPPIQPNSPVQQWVFSHLEMPPKPPRQPCPALRNPLEAVGFSINVGD